ncbi:MAG TPA: nitrilase-related carbon-nitrogen hydrolase [Verrucomicrobiota bacterium]|nr:nitrilase-related carbon-nitrogen hydrolase [Verrucomicrobiota bacterium]
MPAVVLVQHDLAWETPAANFSRVAALLAAAPPPPGALVVLPEMFATGFTMRAEALAEPEDGPTEAFLASLARRFGVTVLAGRPGRTPAGCQNLAIALGPGGAVLARYAKLQPFTPGGEAAEYAPGRGPAVFPWAGLTVAPFICYDLRFPEHFREAARRWRPELFVVIASWPAARIAHWDALLAARAIENQAFVVGVNRTGADPQFAYPGHSRVLGPDGRMLAEAGEGEAVVSAALDVAALRGYRQKLPVLDDLRG